MIGLPNKTITGRGGPGRGQGRKAADGAHNLRQHSVMLDPASIATAKRLGGGEISVGIRRALAGASAKPAK